MKHLLTRHGTYTVYATYRAILIQTFCQKFAWCNLPLPAVCVQKRGTPKKAGETRRIILDETGTLCTASLLIQKYHYFHVRDVKGKKLGYEHILISLVNQWPCF
mmetsp:Transcript_61518/g.71882  ORF Transcript_61518/g.71882 Transcript_61518/m.71882 type:complete len:104 (-) Transcript_61518:286-597(-)